MRYISIHAPREGGDHGVCDARVDYAGHFNPRPPRGGRRVGVAEELALVAISIHAPREGGDCAVPVLRRGLAISIHAPREGGDLRHIGRLKYNGISIHAPREGGDLLPATTGE